MTTTSSFSLLILRVLADKKPHTVRELADTLGLTVRQVHGGMDVLRKMKCMAAEDLPYSITLEGVDWLYEREERAKRVAAKAAIERRPVGRPKTQKPAPAPVPAKPGPLEFRHIVVSAPAAADSIVSTAISEQPALQAAWGVAA